MIFNHLDQLRAALKEYQATRELAMALADGESAAAVAYQEAEVAAVLAQNEEAWRFLIPALRPCIRTRPPPRHAVPPKRSVGVVAQTATAESSRVKDAVAPGHLGASTFWVRKPATWAAITRMPLP